MRRRTIAYCSAALLAVVMATVAFAGDVWKDKPFESWDQKDVQKVLDDSPWAKRVEFAPMPSAQDSGATVGQPGGSGSIADRSGRRGSDPNAPSPAGRALVYIARWYSSRTIREGMVRAAELQGTAEAEAKKPLDATPAGYEIMLLGGDLSSFSQAPEELQKLAYLEAKKTKQKLAPANVTALKDETGRRIVAVVFAFQKKSADGQPTIAPDEKNVDFIAQVPRFTLKFHFDLAKMEDKQGADW